MESPKKKPAIDILDPQTRSRLLLSHPLLTSSESLMTPPIEELYRVIKRVTLLREPGCCVTAYSGVGKTYALSAIGRLLKLQMPNLVIFEHDAQNQQMTSIRSFFKHFLTTVKHKEIRGETYDLRLRLTNRLVDDARISGLNMVVLFIDEAQAMSIQDFLFLKDVYNSLNREGVKLMTIMMGQEPDFGSVLRKLHDELRLDLIARFTMRSIALRPYSSLNDLAVVLQRIDESVYPEDSECSWTQFFFPKAYAAGFRMKNEASSFFAVLKEAANSKSSDYSFPARQCFLAIRALMVDNAPRDAVDMRLPDDAWRAAVNYAQLNDAMVLMNVAKPTGRSEVRK